MAVIYVWNAEKSKQLLEARGLSFEMVAEALANGKLIADLTHPDPSRPHQRLYVVQVGTKICVVPYVTDGEMKFLKTIYESRKHRREFGGDHG